MTRVGPASMDAHTSKSVNVVFVLIVHHLENLLIIWVSLLFFCQFDIVLASILQEVEKKGEFVTICQLFQVQRCIVECDSLAMKDKHVGKFANDVLAT